MSVNNARRSVQSAWRNLIESVGQRCDAVDEQISPFGFELLADKTFMFRRLSRFFVYLKVADKVEASVAEQDFLRILLDNVPIEGDSPANRAKIIITSKDVMVRDRGNDAYLYVRCANLAGTEKSLLRAYGDYISVTPILIAGNGFPELIGFRDRSSARRYVCQVTLMCSSLYRNIACLERDEAATIAHMMRICPDRDLATGERREVSATAEEMTVLNRIIVPLHNRWAEYLTSGSDMVIETVSDFHSDSDFDVQLSRSRLSAASEIVMTTYLDYFKEDNPLNELLSCNEAYLAGSYPLQDHRR